MYEGRVFMYIGKKELKLFEEKRKLEEKYAAEMEEIFGGNELTNLVKNDFNFRRNIVKSIIRDLSGHDPDEIIYAEYPNNYDDVYAIGDDTIINMVGYTIENALSQRGVEGVSLVIDSVIEAIEHKGLEVPDYFKDSGFVIVALDIRSLVARRKLPFENPFLMQRNLFWVLVHEVFHVHPKPNPNERETEINTYHWMYENNYTDPIGLKLFLDLFGNRASEYNISSYIIDDLAIRDRELLLSYLFVYESFLTESIDVGVDLEYLFEIWEDSNYEYIRDPFAEEMLVDDIEKQVYAALFKIKQLIHTILI